MTLVEILIGFCIGVVIALIASLIAMYRVICAILENYALKADVEDRNKMIDKKLSFIFDCLDCIKGTEIDYDRFREIQKMRSKLNCDD